MQTINHSASPWESSPTNFTPQRLANSCEEKGTTTAAAASELQEASINNNNNNNSLKKHKKKKKHRSTISAFLSNLSDYSKQPAASAGQSGTSLEKFESSKVADRIPE